MFSAKTKKQLLYVSSRDTVLNINSGSIVVASKRGKKSAISSDTVLVTPNENYFHAWFYSYVSFKKEKGEIHASCSTILILRFNILSFVFWRPVLLVFIIHIIPLKPGEMLLWVGEIPYRFNFVLPASPDVALIKISNKNSCYSQQCKIRPVAKWWWTFLSFAGFPHIVDQALNYPTSSWPQVWSHSLGKISTEISNISAWERIARADVNVCLEEYPHIWAITTYSKMER